MAFTFIARSVFYLVKGIHDKALIIPINAGQ